MHANGALGLLPNVSELGDVSAPWLFTIRPLGGRAEFLEYQDPVPVK